MKKTLGIGVIGLGRLGYQHTMNVTRTMGARLVAVSDPFPAALERGVEDFTLACGTGCGSIVTALTLMGLVSGENVRVSMPGGELSVSLTRDGDTARDVYLTGPTCVVFEGETKEI